MRAIFVANLAADSGAKLARVLDHLVVPERQPRPE
jgi:hypothetical protein